ncbi:MAG: sugar transferase [Anaerolineae bacterium]|nr:sugar transferase [Anaerolineae bacterium]MDQ7034124.1 sugar transferase [Anaerolineae bacterium]
MSIHDTSESRMLFAPRPSAKRRIQLRLSERRLLMMVGDALAIIAAILIALFIWAVVGERNYDLPFLLEQVLWFVILPSLWFLLATANDYYDLSHAADRIASLTRLMLITLQLIVVYVVVFFFAEPNTLPRLFILYYGIVSFFLLALWRILNPALIGWASEPRRALVIGTDWAAQAIIDILLEDALDAYQVLGVIRMSEKDETQTVKSIAVLGNGSDILPIVLREGISELIVTSTRELPGDVFQGVMDAYEHGVAITPMPILYERMTDRVPVEHVGDNWAVVLPIGGTSVFNPYPLLKRLMDIVMALIGLLFFAPLFPLIALVIKLDSKGAIIFSQNRVGLNGREFTVYKLRSMVKDAEAKTGPKFAEKNDARVTRVGNFLRKTRLDEVPQLFNVLKGDMSMIGPRPERAFHVNRLQEKIPFYRTRHTIRPGLTGWAQVRYKYGATDEDALVKLQYDLYYIRHQSIMLDMGILIRTVGKVLSMAGQ